MNQASFLLCSQTGVIELTSDFLLPLAHTHTQRENNCISYTDNVYCNVLQQYSVGVCIYPAFLGLHIEVLNALCEPHKSMLMCPIW